MTIDLAAAIAVAKGTKKSGKKAKNGARVTSGVLAQVNKEDGGGLNQACISLHTSTESKRFALYRGEVAVTVGDKTFNLLKTDSHSAWLSRQGEEYAEGFVGLYNVLSAAPNEFKGTVEAAGELPELPEELDA